MSSLGGASESDRRRMLAGELAIRVDGTTQSLWHPSEEAPLQLAIDAAAELIEVVAHDEAGEFPLASLLVPFDPESGRQRPVETTVVLPGAGQRLSLRVSPGRDPSRGEQGTELEITYSAAGRTSGGAAER